MSKKRNLTDECKLNRHDCRFRDENGRKKDVLLTAADMFTKFSMIVFGEDFGANLQAGN